MKSKQTGSFLIGGAIALIIASIIGFIGYSHGSSKEKAATEKIQGELNAKVEELREANEKVVKLAKDLEQKDREIKLLSDSIAVNQEVILNRDRTIKQLERRIKDYSTALPVPKKRDPGKLIVESEESDSMKRFDVLMAVYQEVSAKDPVGSEKPKEGPDHKPNEKASPGSKTSFQDFLTFPNYNATLDWVTTPLNTVADLNLVFLVKESS